MGSKARFLGNAECRNEKKEVTCRREVSVSGMKIEASLNVGKVGRFVV